MHNNINGILQWDKLMQKYEAIIRNTFVFHDQFIKNATRRMCQIRKAVLKYNNTSTVHMRKNKDRRKKKPPELIYVGIHVR